MKSSAVKTRRLKPRRPNSFLGRGILHFAHESVPFWPAPVLAITWKCEWVLSCGYKGKWVDNRTGARCDVMAWIYLPPAGDILWCSKSQEPKPLSETILLRIVATFVQKKIHRPNGSARRVSRLANHLRARNEDRQRIAEHVGEDPHNRLSPGQTKSAVRRWLRVVSCFNGGKRL